MENFTIFFGINVIAYLLLIAWRLSDIKEELKKINKNNKIQKLQQLIDKLPACVKREHVMQDLIDLKLSKSDYHYVSLKHKYKDEEIK